MTGRFAAPGALAEPITRGIGIAIFIAVSMGCGAAMFWAGALSVTDEAPAAIDRCERLCHPLEHHSRAGKCYCEVAP